VGAMIPAALQVVLVSIRIMAGVQLMQYSRHLRRGVWSPEVLCRWFLQWRSVANCVHCYLPELLHRLIQYWTMTRGWEQLCAALSF